MSPWGMQRGRHFHNPPKNTDLYATPLLSFDSRPPYFFSFFPHPPAEEGRKPKWVGKPRVHEDKTLGKPTAS